MLDNINTNLQGGRCSDFERVVSKDRIHMHIEYRSSQDISSIVVYSLNREVISL
jgi:REP element-mobilizing transposase RayT